jgi:cleavage and polyadenylation specificity factor subunit 1
LVKDLRRFLGVLNFYRRFVQQAASIQAPLNAALAGPKFKASEPVAWTPTMVQAFDCKSSLFRATLLAFPDPSATLALFTDASDVHLGDALQQRVCDARQPMASYSHMFSPAQQKYSPYYRELFAVHEVIKYFRHMVEGHPFVIKDHKPLIMLTSNPEINALHKASRGVYWTFLY